MKQLQYWEFDFEGKRHHCLERSKSLLRFSGCVYATCADHLETFCMTHKEVVKELVTNEESAQKLRDAIKYAQGSNQLP